MVSEQFPVLAATRTAFEQWNADHPDEEIPRGIGTHEFVLEAGTGRDARGERAIFPFDLWMFQRPQDHLASLDGEDRAAAEQLMRELDGLEVLAAPAPTRLTRTNFRLARA
jgi:hypothetical protein